MTGKKNIKVVNESDSGRNTKFLDPNLNRTMSRKEFADRIENSEYTGYHVRNINGLRTPVSNPDRSEGNNLD
jgi:hypothetical protein